MSLSWNRQPASDAQQELSKFHSYRLTFSATGSTQIVYVKCRSCKRQHGPVWATAKALRKVCNQGKCWTCD